jgi:hypothetical protein
MTNEQIDAQIAKRNRLTNRRDGLTDSKRVKAIDAKLATVPAGQRNDVDLLLGRSCAVLPPRVVMVQHIDGSQEVDRKWSTDAQREAWKRDGDAQGAKLAAQKRDDFLEWVADQTADFDAHMRMLCGDTEPIEHDDWMEGHW